MKGAALERARVKGACVGVFLILLPYTYTAIV